MLGNYLLYISVSLSTCLNSDIDMSLQTLSNPSFVSTPSVIRSGYTSTIPIRNSAYGSCNSAKLLPVSNKKSRNYIIPFHDSRFNGGFWNVGKRVSEACFSFRNGGGLVRVMCGFLERELEGEDAYYMRRCVELARQAIGHTSPNPMVGCVIVKDGKVVGEGFHPKAGQPHAEVTLRTLIFATFPRFDVTQN